MFPQKIEQRALLGLGHKLCSFFTHVLCRNSNSYSTKQLMLLLLRKYIWNPKKIDVLLCVLAVADTENGNFLQEKFET